MGKFYESIHKRLCSLLYEFSVRVGSQMLFPSNHGQVVLSRVII